MAVLRVRHCRALVYCRRAPPRCPACGGDLRGAGLTAAPVRLHCPFRHGHGQPRAFLIRPSHGTFLHGYDGHGDLHVGITNSKGVVYHYDQEGVHRAASGWEQSISIPLVRPDMWELLQHWDNLLEEFSLEEAWLPHRFQQFEVYLHLKAEHSDAQLLCLMSVVRNGDQADFQLSRKTPVLGLSLSESSCNTQPAWLSLNECNHNGKEKNPIKSKAF
ncbi:MKRN2 opposite strand protein isoform X2 [Chamaea fasciata]|uniref:MKRN2 opposite strand protein isoform X2 n=1 Tax=Chamaea fasciata TaxID=190680 RepID=UPI00336A6E92